MTAGPQESKLNVIQINKKQDIVLVNEEIQTVWVEYIAGALC